MFRGLGQCPHCGHMVAIYGEIRPYDPDQLTAGTSVQAAGPPGEPPAAPAGENAKQNASRGIFARVRSFFSSGLMVSARKVLNIALFLLIVAVLGYFSLGYG
ncbi:MAG: hypothetical protein QGG50_07810 [Methanopyri archaeon]|nr:hypothetical protein [Methanopyri archaeon]